jgi:hypothetical protein
MESVLPCSMIDNTRLLVFKTSWLESRQQIMTTSYRLHGNEDRGCFTTTSQSRATAAYLGRIDICLWSPHSTCTSR